MNFELPQIYPITDTRLSGLSHLEQVKLFVKGGARLVQLRDKRATPKTFYESAKEVVEFARLYGTKILINDRVDIALALGADGVHLGQDDLPPERARKILGPEAIIGYSTHSVVQAMAAASLSIDYIAIGPIFPTKTKDDPDAPVGLEGLRQVRRSIGALPLVAIGGISRDNVRSVIEAGADSAAVISAVASPAAIDADLIRMLKAVSSLP